MEEEIRFTMGIKRWRLIAKDRTEWAGIVREAKPLQGPKIQRFFRATVWWCFNDDMFSIECLYRSRKIPPHFESTLTASPLCQC
jgi:hypothetical protein